MRCTERVRSASAGSHLMTSDSVLMLEGDQIVSKRRKVASTPPPPSASTTQSRHPSMQAQSKTLRAAAYENKDRDDLVCVSFPSFSDEAKGIEYCALDCRVPVPSFLSSVHLVRETVSTQHSLPLHPAFPGAALLVLAAGARCPPLSSPAVSSIVVSIALTISAKATTFSPRINSTPRVSTVLR